MNNARLLFRFPIEHITITDRHPLRQGARTWEWFTLANKHIPKSCCGLPPDWRHFLTGWRRRTVYRENQPDCFSYFAYKSQDDAYAAIHRAALAYGRFMVGLPWKAACEVTA